MGTTEPSAVHVTKPLPLQLLKAAQQSQTGRSQTVPRIQSAAHKTVLSLTHERHRRADGMRALPLALTQHKSDSQAAFTVDRLGGLQGRGRMSFRLAFFWAQYPKVKYAFSTRHGHHR